jgi:hypothetical protein
MIDVKYHQGGLHQRWRVDKYKVITESQKNLRSTFFLVNLVTGFGDFCCLELLDVGLPLNSATGIVGFTLDTDRYPYKSYKRYLESHCSVKW